MFARALTFIMLTCPGASFAHECATDESIAGNISGQTLLELKFAGSDQSYALDGILFTGAEAVASLSMTQAKLFPHESKPDRYRRLKGQLFLNKETPADTNWLQGQLLSQGKALVSGDTKLGPCLTKMRAAEAKARNAKLGVWSDDTLEFKANDIDTLTPQAGRFVIVHGKVLSVGDRKTRLYLNFGKKWSQDFTVQLKKKGKGAYKGDITRLQRLKNTRIRVRGYLETSGGPMIRVTHEAQIEFDEN